MRLGPSARLATGGRIDRTRPVPFTFNGRGLVGYAGDTLASALLANGVRVVARSFKFHRPRGIFSAGFEEPNALLRIAVNGTTLPLARATLEPLVPGLRAESENCFPTVEFDLGRALDLIHWLWPAGFYHKTFKWPGWHLYEGLIRRAAGLGRLPHDADPAAYFDHNLHCDVLVVGGGAAGLAAALAASHAGARVVLVEQDCEFGGRLLGERATIDGRPALEWVDATVRELARAPRTRLMRRTLVAGYHDHNVLTAIDQSAAEHARGRIERYWRFRAREVVLATGAIEQPLAFMHNDRPGIMLAGAVRQYLHRYAVAAGRNVVVATSNDDAYRTALDLHDAGVRIAAVVDTRERIPEHLERAIIDRGLALHPSSMVTASAGGASLRSVEVRRLTADAGAFERGSRRIGCDTVAMSAGWNPAVHLYSQGGGQVRYDSALGCLLPGLCRQRVRIVGAANAEFGLDAAIASATEAGAGAARDAGCGEHVPGGGNGGSRRVTALERVANATHRSANLGIRTVRRAPAGSSDRQWVDLQHDVTTADIELAVRENYVSVEHLKRYTTIGMAPDQGKTSNLNALALLAELTGRTVPEVGTTTFRPPFMPVTLGAIAGGAHGDRYAPVRQLPAHAWHLEHGARLEDYGGWTRPACYPRAGETRAQAIEREVRAVRERVGLFDGSPLGKIEVLGPDAATFLDRIYVSEAGSLAPGRLRYGMMLNENAVVIDDGVLACLAGDHYVLSTTSANGDRIAEWLEEWHQCEWPDLEIVMLPVTTQWAVLTLAGRQSRSVLQCLDGDIDFSAGAFPHMSVRTGTLEGLPARVQRVSFTGELSFEVAVPADRAAALWAELMRVGTVHEIEPVGLEGWLVLRLEKGYLHVGTDTDGTTNALDVGFGAVVAKKRGDFVGRRSLLRPNDCRTDRRQLVGLEPVDAGGTLVAGAHIVSGSGAARRSEGFVTSACVSRTLGRSIGLGLLEGGAGRIGQVVTIFDQRRTFPARVAARPFYDPRGERLDG